MIWTLIACIGVSWGGCGAAWISDYPSEESCYRALATMRFSDQPVGESGLKRSTVAHCRPKDLKK